MDSTVAEKAQTSEKAKAKFFSLKTPYMIQGRMTPVVAKTDTLKLQVKVNAEGGENEIHTHLNEDHAFVVLEGQMSIFDETGHETKVQQYQGVMLPKGAFYRYLNTGTQNLVLLRVSALLADRPPAGKPTRIDTDGVGFYGGAKNKELPRIVMEGKFFAESAGLEDMSA